MIVVIITIIKLIGLYYLLLSFGMKMVSIIEVIPMLCNFQMGLKEFHAFKKRIFLKPSFELLHL